jgi:acetyltransferase-like isoleucine patch superfamily enzyme
MPESDFQQITGTWDYATLPANVVLGQDCFLERKASFDRYRSVQQPGLKLGDRVRVYTWTTFNVEPSGVVEVGDDSTLVGAVFMCTDSIKIGRRVIVSYNVTIADSDFHPIEAEARRADAMASAPIAPVGQRPEIVCRPVVIEDDVWIGMGTFILKGVRIGRGARIGAGAVITKDVPDGAVMEGNPARQVEGR